MSIWYSIEASTTFAEKYTYGMGTEYSKRSQERKINCHAQTKQNNKINVTKIKIK